MGALQSYHPRVSRTIAEVSPEVDWETRQDGRPSVRLQIVGNRQSFRRSRQDVRKGDTRKDVRKITSIHRWYFFESSLMHNSSIHSGTLSEFLYAYLLPLCTILPRPTPHIPISSTTSIIDLSSTPLFGLMKVRHLLSGSSKVNSSHYPESLHKVFIVNCPSFFPVIWGWLSGWFDKGTRDKFVVLGDVSGGKGKGKDDPANVLRAAIHPDDLPKEYGGNLAWTFKDPPALDEPAQRTLGDAGFSLGPARFVEGKVILLY